MIKIFKNKMALVMALVMVLSSFALFGCATDEAKDDNATTAATEQTTTNDGTVADSSPDFAESDGQPATAPQTVNGSTILKKYTPSAAFEGNGSGTPVALETVFGTAYKKYNDGLTFNDDGTFTMSIGVTAGPDTTNGTYKITSASNIELTFNNDKKFEGVVITVDGNGIAKELRITVNDYYVIFTQSAN